MKTRSGPRYHGRAVSREEYLDLEDDGFDYEMVGGLLFQAPSHDPFHGEVQLEFGAELAFYLRTCPIGKAMVEVDVFLPDGGDVVRPDISFVSNERSSILLKHIHGAPELICEVLSDRTRARDLGEKAERYLQCGVREYWLIDPRHRTVELRVNCGEAWKQRRASAESPGARIESALLAGFSIDPSGLFPA
ncbi:MAG: Uma2 family endonuclease [bacterium]|nr:Uma2 family endonuclease [bacterium]